MLKIFGSIKRIRGSFMLSVVFLATFTPAFAHAQATLRLPALARAEGASQSPLNFFASARLKTPDNMDEVSTSELQVNLNGTQSIVLKGRGLNVTLQSEPNPFSKTQLLRVSASGDAGRRGETATFSGGSFKIRHNGEHHFMFVEKKRGWVLELRLRPIQEKPSSPQQPTIKKSPAREQWPRKPKRLPA